MEVSGSISKEDAETLKGQIELLAFHTGVSPSEAARTLSDVMQEFDWGYHEDSKDKK